MKNTANIVTSFRILLSIVLFALEPFSISFFALYLLCGFSDVVDGFIARKMNITSLIGSKLDSFADFIFLLLICIKIFPIISIPKLIILWIVIIFFTKVAAVFIACKKYHTIVILHTYANKATGLLLFLFPLTLPFVPIIISATIICIIATFSAVEEMLIHLESKKLDVNCTSLIHIN